MFQGIYIIVLVEDAYRLRDEYVYASSLFLSYLKLAIDSVKLENKNKAESELIGLINECSEADDGLIVMTIFHYFLYGLHETGQLVGKFGIDAV